MYLWFGTGYRREKKRRSMKRKKTTAEQPPVSGSNSEIFAIMLAALSKSDSEDTMNLIIKQCLNKLRRDLLKIPSTLIIIPLPILSLIPFFLNSRFSEIALSGLEVVAAASISSYETNEQIALDDDIVKGLVSALLSCERTVSVASVNAVLDLSTTSIGRQRLIQFSAIDKLIFCFIQVSKMQLPSISLFKDKKQSESSLRIGFKEDEFPILLLQAAITLINTCSNELLEKIPVNLSESLLLFSKKLWAQVHREMLLTTVAKYEQRRHFYMSSIRTKGMAETIFRLSINKHGTNFSESSNANKIERCIFGLGETSFEHFILKHWELYPLLLTRQKDDIFSCFLQQFLLGPGKELAPSFLSSILQNFTNCPPISWDELNIFNFLNEASDNLGCPLIDRQDIRIIKTQHSKEETHFFENPSRFINMDDILRCEEAFKEGYTIAIRGMELRFDYIAAIASKLASLFGQPSAGVNMYLTPPNSQGLARHFDDHCVLVCQLIGMKKWKVFTKSTPLLPRLYASECSEDSMTDDECKHFLMREGDVLYIPRGFLHEACTETDGLSLHMTLGIEVAPPFEWEGFVHVALDHWAKKQRLGNNDSISLDLYFSSVNLMHIAIKEIGNVVPKFRKACLVGAALPSGWFDTSQLNTFIDLIDSINEKSQFLDTCNSVETALIFKHEDPFLELSWLNNLDGEWDLDIFALISTLGKHKEEAKAAFLELKSKFCSEILLQFKDVQHTYTLLIEKYKKVRKQYVNGILALHSM